MFSLTINWEKECKNIKINHLITLCEIVEDYKSFCDDLEILIKSNTNRDFVKEAYKVMKGNFSIYSGKYKNFIKKHKHTIEIMNKYSCLSNLTVLSYDTKGNRFKNLAEDYFFEYIQKNKEDIEKIKSIALKLKKLGFYEIMYGEYLDFTEFEYKLDTFYEGSFAFLENININSTYLTNPIKYKTSNSCYCMCLDLKHYGPKKEIIEHGRKIYLNNLIFDQNILPNEITVGSTINVIKKLFDNKKAEYSDIRNSVDLSIATSDLGSQFEYLKQVVNKIDKVKNNQELEKLLKEMQCTMMNLEKFSGNFEKEIIDSNENITEQTIEKEKKLYLERRYLSSIHVD